MVDVPRDGKTLGEIVTRGNIVMKEVRWTLRFAICYYARFTKHYSISVILKPQRKHSVAVYSDQATWLLCTLMALLLLWIEAKISSYLVERFPWFVSSSSINTDWTLKIECFKLGY